MIETSRADVLAVSLWTRFNPKRCWQGMKSDVSPAAKVGQTQGATHPHAHTHTIYFLELKILLSSKEDNVIQAISPAQTEKYIFAPFCGVLKCSHAHTHTQACTRT